jgi:hypothetical protein
VSENAVLEALSWYLKEISYKDWLLPVLEMSSSRKGMSSSTQRRAVLSVSRVHNLLPIFIKASSMSQHYLCVKNVVIWDVAPQAHAGSSLVDFLYPEDGGDTFPRNVG